MPRDGLGVKPQKTSRRYFDAVSGQAGYYGTVQEGDETAVVTVGARRKPRTHRSRVVHRARERSRDARRARARRAAG